MTPAKLDKYFLIILLLFLSLHIPQSVTAQIKGRNISQDKSIDGPLNSPPQQFDLRDADGNNYVTSVKSQQGGTCWTFGVMASIESSLMKSGVWADEGERGEANLAEYHLDWWNGFNKHNNDDLTPPYETGLRIHYGGDYRLTSAYLSRGEGAVRDVDGQSFENPPYRKSDDYHYYYVRDIEWLSAGDSLENIDEVKTYIMNYGALGTCMSYNRAFLAEAAHYQPPDDPALPNHSIAIVGWDDEIQTQAPQPGAWLCKNSWGEGWGLGGYFWISYYDKYCGKDSLMGAVSFRNVEQLKYDRIYYRDYHGWRGVKEDCLEAFNAFTASGDEYIKALSFYTAAANVEYQALVYETFENGILSGELASKSGIIEKPGFHTVDLDKPTPIAKDSDFYIYLRLSRGGHPVDITSEVPVLLGSYITDGIVESKASPGESFYRGDGGWIDLNGWDSTANFCMKALSTDQRAKLILSDVNDFQDGVVKPRLIVANFFNVDAMSLKFQYNNKVLTYLGFDSDIDNLDVSETGQNGELQISWNDETGNTPMNYSCDAVLTIQFDCFEGKSPLSFVIDECSVTDAAGSAVDVVYKNGAVDIDFSEKKLYLTHNTGELSAVIFNDGSIARNNTTYEGKGIIWKEKTGGYIGGFVYGSLSRKSLNGLFGAYADIDSTLITDVKNVSSDFASGLSSDANFDQTSEALLKDFDAANPYGVYIIQRTYSKMNRDFVVLRYGYINNTDDIIEDFYAGVYLDWMIPPVFKNYGGLSIEDNLVYVCGKDGPFFGVTAINGLSGAMVASNEIEFEDGAQLRAKAFEWITKLDNELDANTAFLETWCGSSISDILPGDTAWVNFALVAGDNLSEIKGYARAAYNKAFNVGWLDVVSAPEPAPIADGKIACYPNPMSATGIVQFELAEAADISLEVFDCRGYKVRTIYSGAASSGLRRISWNGRGDAGRDLAQGVYFYKLSRGGSISVSKFIIIR